MQKLLPIILALIGIGGGVGAGILLKPAAPEAAALADNCIVPEADPNAETAPDAVDTATRDYVKLNNQFVVPVIADGRIAALVVLALSLEIENGSSDVVYQREPKIRDSFLQVLFDHANVGGFEGAFTESNKLDPLRRILLATAKDTLGGIVSDVLITEINRQDSSTRL
ncbi:flagellar basal body-associated FliL family protein [Puniceibacterium confluentis]|uniref:flagellar basal body-associated FliL family protein n=1 Tax=Puniceibacterium confluentis TaxID=1958944 RepID=UPI0011B62506|nr:flagellar basal body-associated FliL family protein [Puniceibacterium confluentis]